MPHSASDVDMTAFIASYAEKLRQDRARREAFQAGDTFARMVAALRDSPEPRRVDEESMAYFPEKTLAAAGWEFATPEDVRLFFDIVGNPDAQTVEPGSRQSDAQCTFDNVSFRHFGLNVWMMFGQGTAVGISNDAAAAQTPEDTPAEPAEPVLPEGAVRGTAAETGLSATLTRLSTRREWVKNWLPELAACLARSRYALDNEGLLVSDFPLSGVRIEFEDGSEVAFKYAFALMSERRAGVVAVFTEHCGYHAFDVGPEDRVYGVLVPQAPLVPVLYPVDLQSLGGVVAYTEPVSGRRVMCSWMGESKRVWLRLAGTELPLMAQMRGAVVEAFEPDGDCPDGLVDAVCLVR